MKCIIFASLRALLVWGVSGVGSDRVSVFVMEGDSVTLNTGVKINQQDRIKWYFNDIRIAQINRDQSKICTDVQCKERFRDRLKLDHQTGSLNITNTRNTDSGEYQLKILSYSSEKIFNVTVTGFLGAEMDKKKMVMAKEPFTSDTVPDKKTTAQYAAITLLPVVAAAAVVVAAGKLLLFRCRKTEHKPKKSGDTPKAKISKGTKETYDDPDERFRDRLDHQTQSLTIMNITNTDSGEYKLKTSEVEELNS